MGRWRRPSVSRAVFVTAAILASVLGGLVGRQFVTEPVSSVRKFEIPLHGHGRMCSRRRIRVLILRS